MLAFEAIQMVLSVIVYVIQILFGVAESMLQNSVLEARNQQESMHPG